MEEIYVSIEVDGLRNSCVQDGEDGRAGDSLWGDNRRHPLQERMDTTTKNIKYKKIK